MRIVVTGAAGRIGSSLCGSLRAKGHDVLGVDVQPWPDEDGESTEGWRFEQADIGDQDALTGLLRDHGTEGVVHLAGNPGESSLREALDSHVVLTQTVLRAMTATGARRLVYASSNHAVGFVPTSVGIADGAQRPRPDTYYGVGKAATEALVSLWVDRFGIEAVAVRIGAVLDKPTSRHLMAIWLSPGDAGRLVDACLTAPGVRYEVVFGISANTRAWWDIEPARALGYRPEDDSEIFAADVEATEENEASRHERQYVGGSFIAAEAFWENHSDHDEEN
jgi:uronate dehydrogenase